STAAPVSSLISSSRLPPTAVSFTINPYMSFAPCVSTSIVAPITDSALKYSKNSLRPISIRLAYNCCLRARWPSPQFSYRLWRPPCQFAPQHEEATARRHRLPVGKLKWGLDGPGQGAGLPRNENPTVTNR